MNLAPKTVALPSSATFNTRILQNPVVKYMGMNPQKFEVCAVIRHQGADLSLQLSKYPRAYFDTAHYQANHQPNAKDVILCGSIHRTILSLVARNLNPTDVSVARNVYFHN